MSVPWVEQIQADLKDNMLPVIHLDLEAWCRSEVDGTSALTPDEHQRARQIQHQQDREAFIAGRWLIRTALGLWTPEGTPCTLHVNPAGKPYSPYPQAPSFNLSHANGMLGLVLAPSGPVGIDLEHEQRPVRAAQKVAHRYFAPEEENQVLRDEQAFLRIWTRREARVKAEGVGIARGFSGLNTFEEERQGTWCYTEWKTPGAYRGTVVHSPPARSARLYVLIPGDERLQSL